MHNSKRRVDISNFSGRKEDLLQEKDKKGGNDTSIQQYGIKEKVKLLGDYEKNKGYLEYE